MDVDVNVDVDVDVDVGVEMEGVVTESAAVDESDGTSDDEDPLRATTPLAQLLAVQARCFRLDPQSAAC